MTLSMAWVRRVGVATEELIFAADSRLRAGYAWDCGPKILVLPRSDCAVAFAGPTDFAYPLILQMANAIQYYPKARNRAMDVHDLRGHTIRVFNGMASFLHDLPRGNPEAAVADPLLLLGGYSWRRKRFAIWTLYWDSHSERFTYRPARPWKPTRLKRIAIAGDATEVAKARLIDLLRRRDKLTSGGFDMEPFEVLRDMIREKVDSRIGGPPQLVKLYRHMNCQPFAIPWRVDGLEATTLLGRTLLDYEQPGCPILDPDNLNDDEVR